MSELSSSEIPPIKETEANTLPRVLIFEDDKSVARLMDLTLRSRASILGIHESAEEVLIKEEGDEQYKVPDNIDVLITDLGLQGMNGFEAARIIREDYEKRGKVPPHMIMVSGSGNSPQVQDDGRKVGISDFFGKPFSPRELSAKMEEGYTARQHIIENTK